MRLDLQKIDERIQQLQEIRRIASDPQMATIMSEFLSYDGDQSGLGPASTVDSARVMRPDETSELVNDVVKGSEAPTNGGLWSRRR